MNGVRGSFTDTSDRYDPDGTQTRVLDAVGTSNGIGWSPDNTKMCKLFTCSLSQAPIEIIKLFDFALKVVFNAKSTCEQTTSTQ